LGSKTKKPLLVFAVTIGGSFILYLAETLRVSLNTFSGFTYPYWALVLITLVNFLIALPVFASFYFLAKKGKIKAEKTIILALIFGLLVGNILNQMYFNLQTNLFFLNSDIFNYLNYLSGNLFFLFFPALAAFLFVELRENKQTIA
jgi:cation transport ATPase